jgi:superfamily I DNA/RNA helicase
LRDSEVLTIEVVGEFLGLDTESNIFTHFCRYYADWFPGLRQITRTTFTRQAANLGKVKQELWQMLARHIPHDPYLSSIDSFPVPVCRFARATYSRLFREVATYGHDEVARHIYYGLRAHVRLAWPGVLVDCALAPANLSDTAGAEDLLQGVAGFVLADRSYWKPELSQRLQSDGLFLLAPYKSAQHEKQPYPRSLTHMRYRIETVFGQLVERFHAKRIWARDLWHLTSRWMRKFLSHTLVVYFCFLADLSYLSFAKLVTA